MDNITIKDIIGIILNFIPVSYGIYLFIKVQKIIKTSTEEEMEEKDKQITRMKRSASIFFFVGVYLLYVTYKRLFS